MTSSYRRLLPNAPLLNAARGEQPSRRPVWFMRQAGRSLPEYRKAREGVGMLDSCFMPELLAEITLQPVRRHDVDAAILFSDIVVPLKAAGVDVEIVPGRGPVVAHPIRSMADVQALPLLTTSVSEVSEGIGIILDELTPTQALIGFAGAPFTLASYLVEGGPSKNHERTKALMHGEPEVWHALMNRLVPTISAFLRTQIEAGVDAIQLFDSWAGFLTERDYREFVLPYSSEILAEVARASAATAPTALETTAPAAPTNTAPETTTPTPTSIPRIHFGVGTSELLGAMSEAGSEVVGVDWRVPLDQAARRMATPKVLQGNLDPALLFAGEQALRAEIELICAQADAAIAAGDAVGHIFNLGHGVLPTTDPDMITRAVEIIHEQRN